MTQKMPPNQPDPKLRPDPEQLQASQLFQADETLRLLANVPPPPGLAGRVHARLQHSLEQQKIASARPWLAFFSAPRLRYAATAVVMVAMAGGAWNLYRVSHTPTLVAPPHQAAPGGFGSAHEMHVPTTLAPIHVPPAPKKKPAASKAAHAAAKAPNTDAVAKPQPAPPAPAQP
jgi:hypothetical protein